MNIESVDLRKSFTSRFLKVSYNCRYLTLCKEQIGTKIVLIWIISTTTEFLRSRNLFAKLHVSY